MSNDTLTLNGVYTMGASKRIGDRSYIGHLWRVLNQNETAAVIIDAAAIHHPGDSWRNKPHLVDKSEFVFTPADHMIETMNPKPIILE